MEEQAVLERNDRFEAFYQQLEQDTQRIFQEEFAKLQAKLEQIFADEDPTSVTNADDGSHDDDTQDYKDDHDMTKRL